MIKQHDTLLTGSQVKVIYKCYFSLSQQVKTLARNHIQEHGSLPIVLPSEVTVHKKKIKKCMEHSYNFMIYIKHLIFYSCTLFFPCTFNEKFVLMTIFIEHILINHKTINILNH